MRPTVLLLNGAFGVGKTTVAALLARALLGAVVFDPERIGYVLRRLPRWLPGSTRDLDDYQGSPLWRALVVRGAARRSLALRQRLVIVPMCISRADYLDALRAGLAERGVAIVEVCLLARDETLLARLAARGVQANTDEGRWVMPRALHAAALHRAGGFGLALPSDECDPSVLVETIVAHLSSTPPSRATT
jgi:predicted kinase